MSEVVNLRTARKQRKRAEARAEATVRAAAHGEAKPVRALRAAREELEARRLDGHRLDAPEE